MAARTLVATISIIALLIVTPGCDSGGGGDEGGVGPIILITNQWREEGNPDHQFSLNSLDDNRTEGAFTGTETRNNFTEFNDLAGFWSDGAIQFTIDRPNGPLRYTGTFEEANTKRLAFTSSAGSLVIVRD